jgi:hypothetical protein
VARKGEVWTGVGATAGWLKQLKDAGEDIERFGVQPMRRPEAKNRLERALLTTETNDRNETGEYPRRNAMFPIDGGFCGSVRLDGGDGTANSPPSHRT